MVTAQLCVTEDEPIRAEVIDGVSGEFIVLQVGALSVFTVNKGCENARWARDVAEALTFAAKQIEDRAYAKRRVAEAQESLSDEMLAALDVKGDLV